MDDGDILGAPSGFTGDAPLITSILERIDGNDSLRCSVDGPGSRDESCARIDKFVRLFQVEPDPNPIRQIVGGDEGDRTMCFTDRAGVRDKANETMETGTDSAAARSLCNRLPNAFRCAFRTAHRRGHCSATLSRADIQVRIVERSAEGAEATDWIDSDGSGERGFPRSETATIHARPGRDYVFEVQPYDDKKLANTPIEVSLAHGSAGSDAPELIVGEPRTEPTLASRDRRRFRMVAPRSGALEITRRPTESDLDPSVRNAAGADLGSSIALGLEPDRVELDVEE